MPVTKAIIRVLETGEEIKVMFNPSEYTVSADANIGSKEKKPFFNEITLNDFKVKLIFDTYEKKADVRKLTNKIGKLVMPTISGKKIKKPPICLFIWGKVIYKGIISNISEKFTLFLSTGIPVRAELEVTFKALVTPEQDLKNKGMDACRKVWTVKSGDRLDLIANETLKDPALWRMIAKENNIDNPLSFPKNSDIGRMLIIPD
jgi:nucleoid-associated protein YgaU